VISVTFESPSMTGPQALVAFEAHPELQSALQPLAEERYFAPGEDIFCEGAPSMGIFLLLDGSARLFMRDGRRGAEIASSARTLGPGCILGLPATLCSTTYNFTAQAIDRCRVGHIETAKLNDFLRQRPDLCMQIVQIMSRELADISTARARMRSCPKSECALNGACHHCN
jgi:CRP-like cAMP-binding protein